MRKVIQVHVKNSSVVKGVRYEGLNSLCQPEDLLRLYCHSFDEIEIVVNDVVASLFGRNGCFELLELLRNESSFPVTYQGGVRTLRDIDQALSAGADRVAINSHIYKDLDFCRKAVQHFGSSTLVASVDYQRHHNSESCKLRSDYGREPESVSLVDHLRSIADIGFGEVILGSINRDGMGSGYDIPVLDFCNHINIPILLSGGCSSINDLTQMVNLKPPFNGCVFSSIAHYLAVKFLPDPSDGHQMVKNLPFENLDGLTMISFAQSIAEL